jgi:hypothetical protein
MQLHANAALSLNQRRRMVLRVIEHGWPLAKAAEAADVSGRCQGSRDFLRCDHENSPPVIAGLSDATASRWARIR